MPPEVEPFALAIIVALAAAWIVAFRVMFRIGETWQKVGISAATVAVVAAALGFSALVTQDLVGRPRVVLGTVQSLGTAAERAKGPAFKVVVNGTTYWARRTDYEKLRVGERIRGQAGASFNFLRRVDVLPALSLPGSP